MTIEAGRARASRRDDPVVIDLVTRARDGDQQAWDALVERYAPLIWSVCRRNRLSEANAVDVGHSVWLQLADQLDRVRDPAALAGWLVTTTRRECGRVLCAAPEEEPQAAEQEMLTAEQHGALYQAFTDLSPCCQQLIALLAEDPPVPYAQISATLGIPVDAIGPARRRCLDQLRRHPAIAALASARP